ncbi:ABC transporter permease [Notoacmeibacter ruber]|uniref:ABC transporter permease n=1 Tax=Notoacmeibacter ruber TaxID=2670375 RepID=A0A3L7J4F3_9HYPH|nr:ABC transporter permease [Notoacmeibacter ruber]RLQ85205.1 ABC transporter permease [Notoacmeibacter ruber]
MTDATADTSPPRRQKNPVLDALYRNKFSWIGIGLIVTIVLLAIFAPLVAPYDPLQQSILSRLQPPSVDHWFGTDSYGRDVLSRLLYGARISLAIGFLSVLAAMIVGSTLGILAGYIGGVFDQLVMGLVDVMLSFPTLLLGLMVAAMLGASFENLIIAIAITETAPFARVARAPTIAVKRREYIEAGRSLGFTPFRIMGVHILPNILSDIVVVGSLWMASAIRTEAALAFIGLGVRPPTPTWGGMIREGFDNILNGWWLIVFPSLSILFTVLALNILGDALRDAIDPKTRSEG